MCYADKVIELVAEGLRERGLATPEEERTATLGGMIPGSSGTDAFDISLYLAAIPLFGSLALFLFFPAIAPMLAGSDLPPPSA